MQVDDPSVTAATTAQGTGRRFVTALAARDAPALLAMFSDKPDFRAITPGRYWQPGTAAEVVNDVILGAWFGPGEIVEQVQAAETGRVGGRHTLGYRLMVASGDGRYLVDQHAYFDLTDGKITWMRVLCSGFQPIISDQ
jgi:hypothetical protein